MPVGHDLNNEQLNVAIKDPQQLINWLQASDRKYLVLETRDLIEALATVDFVGGVENLQQIISLYRDHRRRIPTGLHEEAEVNDHVSGKKIAVKMQIFKDELLEPEELTDLIEWAMRQRTAATAQRAAKKLVS